MPHLHTWRNRLLTVPQMRLSLRNAARIIAVSQYTADDLLARLPGIDPARVRVIPEAPAPGLLPASSSAIAEVKRRLRLPDCIFLFLGAMEPRKNVPALIRAFARLRADGDDRAALVIAGAQGWNNSAVWREVRRLGLDGAVTFAGYIDADDLPALMER